LHFAKPRARISHLISVKQADIGTAEPTAFIEAKLSRVELQDRAAVRRISRGQRREQRERRADAASDRIKEQPADWIATHLPNERLLIRVDSAKTSA
jgi:hypothetical protein